jgi:CHASE2 domain-containing sensor protein
LALISFRDAFIAYGQGDSQSFAIHLKARLTELGYSVWLEQVDMPWDINAQTCIAENVAQAHNILFILSSQGVCSEYGQQVLAQALRYNKRIIPLIPVPSPNHPPDLQQTPANKDGQTGANPGPSSDINRPSAINELEWIDFQEDFQQGLETLVETLNDQTDRVQLHTEILAKMLTWKQHQCHSSYLLMGDLRLQATTWLKESFKAALTCCQPTDDQCEFIAASTKYAENSMVQVLLCYAKEDRDLRVIPETTDALTDPADANSGVLLVPEIRRLLLRAGFTIWDPDQDLEAGDNTEVAVSRATEACDNCVLLLTPNWLQSALCLQVLIFAVSMNKRIVPLLVQPTPAEKLPDPLQGLKPLNFCRPVLPLADSEEGQHLIHGLNQEAEYHRRHKLLLLQSLQWERQRRNPSLLLRGSQLANYQTWLAEANQRQQYQPLRLQKLFMAESLNHAADQTWDVYIISDAGDLDFSRKLSHMLQLHSKSTCFEQAKLSEPTTLQADFEVDIRQSENCLFVLSAAALQNERCAAELRVAQSQNKRIVVVVYRTADEDLPATLANFPQINFQRRGRDFATNFGELYRILESDRKHVALHTKLLSQAQAWHQAGRQDVFLLHHQDLPQATAWLQKAAGKIPGVTSLQRDYIAASQQLPQRRLKLRSLGLASAGVTLLVIALRLLGLLQPAELAAFDWLMKRHPNEPQDQRFLIVSVDAASNAWLREQMKQGRYQPSIGPIPDGALAAGLDKLIVSEPALIGLALNRDFDAELPLAQKLVKADSLIGICSPFDSSMGVSPPPELPPNRVGFNTVIRDQDNTVRRQALLQMPDTNFCDVDAAFSLRLARAYLDQQGVPYTAPAPGQPMQLGTVPIPHLATSSSLASGSGGYAASHRQKFGPYQTMLNYRIHQGDVRDFAAQVSLQAVLTDQVPADLIRDRIILIGYGSLRDDGGGPTNPNRFESPYGSISGVELQGQMASQLISAVLDDRPLIWWWPLWGDILWICGWSALGGLVVWRLVRPGTMALASIALVLGLGGLCYGVLVVNGGWLAFIPAALASLGTAGMVAGLAFRLRFPSRKRKLFSSSE